MRGDRISRIFMYFELQNRRGLVTVWLNRYVALSNAVVGSAGQDTTGHRLIWIIPQHMVRAACPISAPTSTYNCTTDGFLLASKLIPAQHAPRLITCSIAKFWRFPRLVVPCGARLCYTATVYNQCASRRILSESPSSEPGVPHSDDAAQP